MSAHQFGFIEQGSGQPLVLIHGMAANAQTWQPQIDQFSKSHRVISLDLPGYGQTPSLPESTFPAVAHWLHQVLADLSVEQPILIGHSYGGMIAQEYLATYPGHTKAAVLYGTSPAFGRPDGEWQQKFIRARLKPLEEGKTMPEIAAHIAQNLVGSAANQEGIALVQEGVATTSEQAFRDTLFCLVTFDQRQNLAKINIPCLAVVGEEDSSAPPAVMEKMASKIPDSTFITLPKLGHMLHLEDPKAFNTVVQKFLDEQP